MQFDLIFIKYESLVLCFNLWKEILVESALSYKNNINTHSYNLFVFLYWKASAVSSRPIFRTRSEWVSAWPFFNWDIEYIISCLAKRSRSVRSFSSFTKKNILQNIDLYIYKEEWGTLTLIHRCRTVPCIEICFSSVWCWSI